VIVEAVRERLESAERSSPAVKIGFGDADDIRGGSANLFGMAPNVDRASRDGGSQGDARALTQVSEVGDEMLPEIGWNITPIPNWRDPDPEWNRRDHGAHRRNAWT
jgi:hypothetical protein